MISIIPEQNNDNNVSQDIATLAGRDVTQVAHYFDVLTQWLRHTPAARRTFVSLCSYAGLVRNPGVQTLYRTAAFAGFDVRYPFDRYLFVSRRFQDLRQMQTHYHTHYRAVSPDVLFLAGDSNDLAQGIVGETLLFHDSAGNLPLPTIVFINPNELRLRWSTIETLARLPHLYMVLFYPLDALNRHMPRAIQSHFCTEVDLFFGTTHWRELYVKALGQNKQRTLLPYYIDRLRSLGFCDVMCVHSGAGRQDEDAALYSLLFAHKQAMPPLFWEEVIARSTPSRRNDTAPLRVLPSLR